MNTMERDGPPADAQGPTVPRMLVGIELHRFREAAGITPELAAYEIRGVRPKSPPTTRSTRRSSPRSCRSSTRAATAWSKNGARCFIASKTWWLTA